MFKSKIIGHNLGLDGAEKEYLERPDTMEEACGLFGIYLPDSANPAGSSVLTTEMPGEEIGETEDPLCLSNGGPNQAAQLTHFGLLALQHRGQESAGIAVADKGEIQAHKAMGLVTEVFDETVLARLQGSMAIGHVRYSTSGTGEVINAEPLVFRYFRGAVAIAQNGNLVNSPEMQQMLTAQGSIFQSITDSEIIANLLARYSQNNLEEALMKCMLDIKGAYALLILGEEKLIGVRDPYGIRPLCVGRLKEGYVLASESCALDTVGAEFIRDLEPGEILVLDKNGMTSRRMLPTDIRATCVFEFVYFARPDSNLEGINVGLARKEMGRQLARECQIEADLVISVPDSGTPAALGYAEEAGLPYAEGLMKNRYIGRTFIRPAQAMRDLAVRLKLNAVKNIVQGKRVVMVDDSIVRGTTSRQIVRMLREAGATEVHMVISSPPTCYSCYYGIDTSDRKDLIAARMGIEEIRAYIGADTLHYLSLKGLRACFPGREADFCTACFSGEYPIK